MTKVHKIDLSTISDQNPLAMAIDKKYIDFPDLAGFFLASTYITQGKDSQGNARDYLVLIFQKP